MMVYNHIRCGPITTKRLKEVRRVFLLVHSVGYYKFLWVIADVFMKSEAFLCSVLFFKKNRTFAK